MALTPEQALEFLRSNIVHLGYGLQLCALLARDVLWLRGLLVSAQTLNALYAFQIGAVAIGGWNLVFVLVNLFWIVRILRERRAVAIPEDLQGIYRDIFAAMKPREFLRFWSMGQPFSGADQALVEEGHLRPQLILVEQGQLRVHHGDVEVARLQGPTLVGEISALTGHPATADVQLLGPGRWRTWERKQLERLRLADTAQWTRIQSVIGGDVVRKLRRTETPVSAVRAG